MYTLTLIVFALIISAVPFSIALTSSVYRCIEWKEALRIALVFALSHAAMAAIGWGVGYGVKAWLSTMGVPVALFIMFFMALRYFTDARRKSQEARTLAVKDMRILMGFALVTSINTLLLGISLGIVYSGWLEFAGMVAVIAFLVTRFGIYAGKQGWLRIGRVVESLASLLLIIVTIFILLQFIKLV